MRAESDAQAGLAAEANDLLQIGKWSCRHAKDVTVTFSASV